MSAPTVTMVTEGKFFNVDISKTFGENRRRLMQEIAAEGQAQVRARTPYYTGPKGSPDHIRDFIVGRVVSMKGTQWKATAVVSSLFHMFHKRQVNVSYRDAALRAAVPTYQRRLKSGEVISVKRKGTAESRVRNVLIRAYKDNKNGQHYGYGQKLERRFGFFRKGVAPVRAKRREGAKLLKGVFDT